MRLVSAALLCSLALIGRAAPAAPESAPAAASPGARFEEVGQPVIRVVLPREYRGHNQVWRFAETPDGRILFGNLNQVFEFDGLRWRAIPVPGASYVRGLAADAHGTVWVAGVNELGRLQPDATGALTYESMRARVPSEVGDLGTIWCVHALADGVWFQSSAALLRWDGQKFDVWMMRERSVVLSFPYRDSLLVARADGWYAPRPGGQWELLASHKLLPRHVWPQPDGRTLILTGTSGLQELKGGELHPVPTEIDDWLRAKRIYGGVPLPGNRLLVLSLQGGALILGPDLKLELAFDSASQLPSDTVIAGWHDRHGALWLGTDSGIVRAELDSPVRVFGAGHGLGRRGVESMERIDGRVLIGTGVGTFELQPPEKLPGNPRARERQGFTDHVTYLMSHADGMFVGGVSGLKWVKGGQTHELAGPTGVRELVELRGQPQRIVATHLNGIASWHRAGESWEFEGVWPDLNGELRGLVQDAEGALWVGTPNAGVIRFVPSATAPRAEQIERFADESGLRVERGPVWIDSMGGRPLFKTMRGFHRWEPAARRFVPDASYGERFADGSTSVRLSAPDRAGGLWMLADFRNNGLPEVLYGRDGTWRRLPMPDADRIDEFTFINCEQRDGREVLWIGGKGELRRVDLTAWRERPPPELGRTLLRGLRVGRGRQVPPTEAGVELSADERTVRFTFATPGLAGESAAVHESRLLGFADGDALISSMGERTFTNLPPGHYTFEVRGRSGDGRWSLPAVFPFAVRAPWWQTTWAGAGYLVFGTVLLVIYVRWRIRRLMRERRRLEAVIVERTAELARKNAELERLHRVDQDEKLAARLAEEKAQLELLRYQLNPHFLYNSLNSIRALVYTNAEAAGEMVTRLSEFCRSTLTRRADGLTTVADEAEMLQSYLDIERTRWQDGLHATIEVDAAVRSVPMPQFLFLPLIENAIKYGGRTSPGLLEVRVRIAAAPDDPQAIVCEVANTGEWVERGAGSPGPEADSTHIGLENLRQRVVRYYGPAHAPEIVTDRPGWVTVRLRLPRAMRSSGSRAPRSPVV